MSTIDQGCVDVVMPAHAEAVVLARLQVAGVARLADLDVDEIADLRLAIEELCVALLALDREHDGRLHLTLEWGDAVIAATCVLEDAGRVSWGEGDELSELSSQILGALVDEHGLDRVGEGSPRAWLRKKRSVR